MPVEIEVLEFDRPSPVGIGQSRLKGSICKFAYSVVQIEDVMHVLAGNRGKKKRADRGNFAHGGLGAVMIGPCHIGNQQVGAPIPIEIRDVGSHGKPGSVRGCLSDHVGEGAIAIIAIKSVRILKVVADVDIG